MIREHIVNDLELTVINDGRGEQCGFAYTARVDAGRSGDYELFRAAVTNYNAQRIQAYSEPASLLEIREAAKRLLEYYVDHAAECDEVNGPC